MATVAGLFLLGDLGLRLLGKRDDASKGLRVLSIITAIVILGVIQFVPVLGGLLVLLVWLFGLGAVHISLYRAYTSSPAV